ncbi:GntR family transcriptional regulator [[Mycobacterium] appelbergii]|uniref:GntR family transcriptional regulator n=1 Tax=[Mycobacterium] appelbergii TaxID=2939269 RepID=UPI002938E3F0|nr:GntR family transcriptional regulator [Mycobacterium sp. 21AC1]
MAITQTRSGQVYDAIRAAILAGHFKPGQKLKPNELREQYGVSLSVVREALARLAEQRLVLSQPNRGFQVVPVSEKALRDLTDLRVMVESFALRRAIERGNVAWESEVVAAHHTLAVTPTDFDGSNEVWEEAHRRFHYALIDGCDMPVVLDLCSSLFDASRLYRRLTAPWVEGTRDIAAEHAQLMDAALARDVDVSLALLELHFRTTTKVLLTEFLHVEPDA